MEHNPFTALLLISALALIMPIFFIMAGTDLNLWALRKIRLRGDALILCLHWDGETVVPHADHVLELGDRLGLIGSPQALEQAEALLLAG